MRRVLIGAATAVAVLAAAHALLWRWAESRLVDGYDAWLASQREAGWSVASGPPARGGWPLRAQLALPALSIAGGQPDLAGGLEWHADRVVLAVALVRPDRLELRLEGLQGLRVGNGPEIPYTADRLTALLPLDPGAPPRSVDIAGANLRVGLPQRGLAAHPLTLALLSAHLDSRPAAAQGEPALALAASAQDIALPPPAPGGAWSLGAAIASVSVEGALTGPLPRASDPMARATQWRDGGGTLEVRRLAIGWGPLGLSATATLALDDRLQPMGAGSAHLVGAQAALDALASGHAIGAAAAGTVRALLGMMTHPAEGEGVPQVDLPLTLQNRTVSMGRLPLAKLPEFVWPGTSGQ